MTLHSPDDPYVKLLYYSNIAFVLRSGNHQKRRQNGKMGIPSDRFEKARNS